MRESSFERYRGYVKGEGERAMAEAVLMTVEAQLHNELDEWIQMYSNEPDSLVYRELVELRFGKEMFPEAEVFQEEGQGEPI